MVFLWICGFSLCRRSIVTQKQRCVVSENCARSFQFIAKVLGIDKCNIKKGVEGCVC